MQNFRIALAIVATAVLAMLPEPSRADMGLAPVGPNGVYVSFEGGYLYQDGNKVDGFGAVSTPGGPTNEVYGDPKNGFFVGGLIGYEHGTPFLFSFHRAELYVMFGRTEDSSGNSAPPLDDITLKTVDGGILGFGGLNGNVSVERKTWEGAIRLEHDQVHSPHTTITWVLAPFIRNFKEDTNTVVTTATCCGGCCEFNRGADVDSFLYGVYLAAEPEHLIHHNLYLVGRVGAGIYGYNTDGSFNSGSSADPDLFSAHVSDGSSGVGFRGLLGAGLKLKVSPHFVGELYSEADYFSDVGTAKFANNQDDDSSSSRVGSDSLWEVRAGARVTIGFDSDRAPEPLK